MRSQQPDLIVLDLFLPELDGTDVCRLLRADSRVPIIMLTARATDEDKLLGLNLGADDYLTKPFNPRALVARVRAVLRRTLPDDDTNGELHFGDLAISLVRREVAAHGQPVSLTPTGEFRLLETLVREPGRVQPFGVARSCLWFRLGRDRTHGGRTHHEFAAQDRAAARGRCAPIMTVPVLVTASRGIMLHSLRVRLLLAIILVVLIAISVTAIVAPAHDR
ncbi:response regulator transcription factor [Candidatus Amarolinea dominans]|uniref:response regulator transcription factor n=1 Tax=Candidatus Amarolinea dominans TaxID=3140696 RepID=UPI0031CC5589